MLIAKPEVKKEEPTATQNSDPKIKELEESLVATQEELARIQTSLGKADEMKVVEIKDAALRRYPEANPRTVQKELQAFFFTNNRHPTAGEIESIVKENHDFVAGKLTAQREELSKPVNPLPPILGGGPPPSLSKTKTPHISDIEAWKGLAHEDNVSPG